MMKDIIRSYCKTCHDNTEWKRFSEPLPVKQDNGKTYIYTKYECTQCGSKNTFSNYGLTE